MMKTNTLAGIACLVCLVAVLARCASTPPAAPAAAEPVTPADFVASMVDIAAGRNEALSETGLVLKRIEFRLAVGTETKAGGSIEILVLDAGIARTTQTSFLQELTLEIPASRSRSAAPRPLVPGVREFVEAAMDTARDLARATGAAGLPQRLKSMELTAKITQSRTLSGGITATIPAWVRPSLGVEAGKATEGENIVRLIFEAP
jgi:hypothetical protein